MVRQIIEKAQAHNVSLHFNFIDFKAAFDTIWREALWKIMLHVGIHQKIVTLKKKCTKTQSAQCKLVENLQISFQLKLELGKGA